MQSSSKDHDDTVSKVRFKEVQVDVGGSLKGEDSGFVSGLALSPELNPSPKSIIYNHNNNNNNNVYRSLNQCTYNANLESEADGSFVTRLPEPPHRHRQHYSLCGVYSKPGKFKQGNCKVLRLLDTSTRQAYKKTRNKPSKYTSHQIPHDVTYIAIKLYPKLTTALTTKTQCLEFCPCPASFTKSLHPGISNVVICGVGNVCICDHRPANRGHKSKSIT